MEVAWVTDFKEEYTIERRKVPVNKYFAADLWETYFFIMQFCISRGIAPFPYEDYTVTFRCLVENFSVWTLIARDSPLVFKDLTAICNEIIKNVQEHGKIMDEEKHIKQLRLVHTEIYFDRREPKALGK